MKSVLTLLLLSISLIFSSGMTSYAQDFEKGLRAAQSGDFATALGEWMPLAKQGDAIAQYNLGAMYANGDGVPQDNKEAVRLYRLGAEQGDADAQFNLGGMYQKGLGVPQDNNEAVRLYRLAADQAVAKKRKLP